jgi:PKD repeat protein
VQANGVGPVLSCDENVKCSSKGTFLKPQNASFDVLKFSLYGNGYQDEAYIRFGNGAGNSYDEVIDARKFLSWNTQVPSLSSLDSAGNDLSVNSLPSLKNEMVIPVKTLVGAGASGIYTLTIDSAVKDMGEICIYLHDLVTGQKRDLKTTMSYTFFISDTTTAPRFLIHAIAAPKVFAATATCKTLKDGWAKVNCVAGNTYNYSWRNSSNSVLRQIISGGSTDSLALLAPGQYTVMVTNTNSLCGTSELNFMIAHPPVPQARFTLEADSVDLFKKTTIVTKNKSDSSETYQWNFNDGSAPEISIEPVHQLKNEGLFNVQLIAFTGACSDTATRYLRVYASDATAIAKKKEESEMRIYPNPGKGKYFIDLPEQDSVLITIYDAKGQVILKEHKQGKTIELDITNESRGIYFYEITTEGKNYSGKLICN